MNCYSWFDTQFTDLILCLCVLWRQTAVEKIGKIDVIISERNLSREETGKYWGCLLGIFGADWWCGGVILILFKKGGWNKDLLRESRRTRESTRSYKVMSHVHTTSTKSERVPFTPLPFNFHYRRPILLKISRSMI